MPARLAWQTLGPRTLKGLIDASDEYGCTSLMLASQYGDYSTVVMLIQAGGDIKLKSADGMDALMMACKDGRALTAELLMDHHADVNETNLTGSTALILACVYGHTATVRALIQMGASANAARHDGRTALHRASQYGHLGVVKLLLEQHAKVDMISNGGETALLLASENGHERVVSSLLGTNLAEDIIDSVPLASKQQYTPLMGAAAYGHISVVNTLLKQGASVNYRRPPPYHDTCLMRAAKFNRVEVVDVLLRTLNVDHQYDKVNLMDADDEGRNGLHHAVIAGHLEPARALLRAGPKGLIDIQTSDGAKVQPSYTALMFACEGGHKKIIDLLVERKSDPLVRNKDGKRAIELLDKRHARYEDIDKKLTTLACELENSSVRE